MKIHFKNELWRVSSVLKSLFSKEKFNFNQNESTDYALFHENGLHSKTTAIKKLVKDYFLYNGVQSLSLLDIGCGTGEIELIIKGKFTNVTGVDSVVESVKKAVDRKLNNCSFIVCDAGKLCFNRGLFDMIILVNTLHHTSSSIRNILQGSLLVLKKGGLITIFELNPFNPLQLIWFYLLCPIDRRMRMVYPKYLENTLKEISDGNGSVTTKFLSSSLLFEYMTVFIKQ